LGTPDNQQFLFYNKCRNLHRFWHFFASKPMMIAARDPLAQPRQTAFDSRMRASGKGAINPTILDKHSIFNIKKQYLFRLLNLL
jgi:hypothetical protein